MAGLATIAGSLFAARPALAEVTVAEGDDWEAFVAGRVGVFFSYAFGDAYPPPAVMGQTVEVGSGVDEEERDLIPETDAMGEPDLTQQGTLQKMRVRSGYYPNILTIGARKTLSDDMLLHGRMSIWGTIESEDTYQQSPATVPANGIRDNGVYGDFREGFLELDASWGKVTGGRFLGLFSRGLTEIDILYGHGYGAGFPQTNAGGYTAGHLTRPGPMGGMTGFGVLAATYQAGLTYTSPDISGLKIAAGLFDGVTLVRAGWSANRTPRPEFELTYDMDSEAFKMHLFGNGAYQKVYNGGDIADSEVVGFSFGGRFEVGPLHLGVGGFTGTGTGLTYAFDGNPSQSSPSAGGPRKFRPSSGYVAMLQYVLGDVDLGAGYGQTMLGQSDDDTGIDPMTGLPLIENSSSIETQTGISLGVVYHLSEFFHLDADFINGAYKWRGGEEQQLNVVNAGATLTF